MAEAEATVDTGVSEDNLLGDGAEFIEGDAESEAAAAPEEVATLADAEPEENSEVESGGYLTDAEAAFLGDDAEGEEEIPEGEPEDEESEEEVKGASPRLQKRLRDVISQRNETQQSLEKYQQWEGQVRQQFQTMAQQSQGILQENQQLRQQMTGIAAEMRAIKEYGLPQKSQEPEDYATQFQRETLERAQAQAQELVDPRIKQLEGQIAQMKELDQKRQSDAKSQANRQKILSATESAVAQHLFPEGYPEDIMSKPVGKTPLRNMLSNLVLAHSYGTGLSVPDATRQLQEALRFYGLGQLRYHGSRGGKKISKSQKTTSLAPQGGQAKGGKPRISKAQAQKMGFDDSLEAAMASTGLIGEE